MTGGDGRTIHVWRVPDGEHRKVTLPVELKTADLTGFYDDEVVVLMRRAKKPNTIGGETLYRIPIASMAVVP